MSKNIKEERYRWISPILDKEVSIVNLVKVCPYSESSLKRWLKAFRKGGIDVLEPKSTQPKTSPQETPIWIKERVIELRKETGLCAKKLHQSGKKARRTGRSRCQICAGNGGKQRIFPIHGRRHGFQMEASPDIRRTVFFSFG